MTDETLQKKLNQLTKLANELSTEAKRRYSPSASLFYEAEGTFHITADDCDGNVSSRQEYIQFSSEGYCRMGCGAW
jgi:hypothetical protein